MTNQIPDSNVQTGGRRWVGRSLTVATRWVGVLVVLLAIGCASLPEGPELAVAGFEEVGALPAPAGVVRRDGGASGIVGDRLLWTFGETVLAEPAADGRRVRVNSAALAPVHDPLRTTEPRDGAGAPLALIAMTREERAFDEREDTPRVALRPTAVIEASATRRYVVYRKSHVAEGELIGEVQQVGLARIEEGQTVARRLGEPLFESPGPLLWNPLVDGNFVYLYGPAGRGRFRGEMAVARVRRVRMEEREAYEYWDGAAWVADASSAAGVVSGVPGEMTVHYNRYLRRYLAVHSERGGDRIVLRTADRPEGPFSEPVFVEVGLGGSGGERAGYRSAREHPHLASADGRRIAVTFYRPTGPERGEVVLGWVELGE